MKTKKIRQNIKETASVVTIQKYARRFLTEWNFTSNQKKATKESKRSNSLILLPTVPTEKKKKFWSTTGISKNKKHRKETQH